MSDSVSRDVEELNFVAEKFGTTEFEIFGLAFYDCHGYRAEDSALNDMFMQFLHDGTSPPWLRTYVKRRVQGNYALSESIRQSALISTGASSAIVKWRPSVDIFSFTLIGAVSGGDYQYIEE